MTILLIAEMDNLRQPSQASLNILYQLGQAEEIDFLLWGKELSNVAVPKELPVKLRHLLVCEGRHFEHFSAEDMAAIIFGLAADYDRIIAPSSQKMNMVMAQSAGKLKTAPLLDVTSLIDDNSFEYASFPGIMKVVTPIGGQCQIMTWQASTVSSHTSPEKSFVQLDYPSLQTKIKIIAAPPPANALPAPKGRAKTSDQDHLETAKIVIGCGGGLENQAQADQIKRLADRLGAAIGASKVAVENGLLPNATLIGQSGKTIAPQIYLALAISGSMHHLSAVMEAETIIAINIDPEAPIHAMADYSLIGTIDEIVPQLVNALT